MKDSLIIWRDKVWSGGFLFAAWFTLCMELCQQTGREKDC